VLVGSRSRGVVGPVAALAAAVLPGFAILMIIAAMALDSHASLVVTSLVTRPAAA